MAVSISRAGPAMTSIRRASNAMIVTGIMIRKKTMVPMERLIEGLAEGVIGPSATVAGVVPAVSMSPVRRIQRSALATSKVPSTILRTIFATTRPMKKIRPAAIRLGTKANVLVVS
jgi:hypothetical protein